MIRRLARYLLLVGMLSILYGCENSDKILDAAENKTEISNEVEQTAIIDTEIEIDDSEKSPVTYSPTNHVTTTSSQTIVNTTFIPTEALIKKYQDKSLTVLDSSEVILDGASTLMVTFSVPLNPKQNFTNLIRLVDAQTGPVDGDWELSSSGLELRHRYLAPNRKLALSIDKMLIGINESRLAANYHITLTTRYRSPVVGFSSNGSLLPSQSMSGLPVTTLNVNQIDVNFFRIKADKVRDFITSYSSISQLSNWRAEYALPSTDLVYSARFNLSPKPNVQENLLIDLANIEALNQEGTYVAIMNQAGSYHYANPMTIFSISNIGLSVHTYSNGKLAIFAHRLDNGQALANIKLTALCRSKRDDNKCNEITANTNKQGYAELKLSSDVVYTVLTASDGSQMSFIQLDRNALDLSEFNVTGSPFYQKQLFTFAARDLFRPAETIYLNALLRDTDGQLLPEQPIQVTVISPTGQNIKDFVWRGTKNSGFYQTEFAIPANAETGTWTFKFNLGDDIYRYHYFTVEEFLPERMAIALTPMSEQPIVSNNNASFTVKSWYLYGAPASGNELRAYASLVKERTIAALPGFKIGSETETNTDRQLNRIEQTLDKQGITQVNIDKQNWQDIKSPIQVILQASVLDIGGRPVTRRVAQSIWPADYLPAIRPLFADSRYYDWSVDRYVDRPTIDEGNSAEFAVAYIDNQGNKLASNTLIARFIKERRDYYWTWSESEGWKAKYDVKEFVVAEQQLDIADNDTAKVSFLPDDWGSYRLEVTDESNKTMSSLRFWCGYSWSDNTGGAGAIRPDQVKLSLDKTAYSSGDTAIVHVKAPVSGVGYISLESNSGTLWMKEISVPEDGIDVHIPIKNWGRHDIYINTMIIRPSTDSSIQTVKRAMGLLYLPIDTTERQLKLTLATPAKVYPESTIKIKLKLAESQVIDSDKVTVLLSAVDSGILNITNFKTPDPYSALLGRKRYDVEQFDVYGKLIEGNGRHVGISFGGDMYMQGISAGGKKPLTEVNIVAQQLKTLSLNAEGDAEVELAIPDFNGELRLMAQVWDNNRFGFAEQTVTVASPVIAELATPRFLSGGDETIMAFELRNLTDIEQNVQINASSVGLISLINDSIPKAIILAPKEQKIVSIPAMAEYGFGQGKITINVSNIVLESDSNYQLSRSRVVGVRPAYAAISRSSSAVLNGGESWLLSESVLADLISNTVEGELVISHKPPLNITKYIKSLYAYPYGCLEQTISRLYPSLYVNHEQLTKLGIKSETDEERRKNIQIGIDRLFGMQRTNGSFGLWSRENAEEYWLTVYAVDFLLQAQERGYQINQQGLNKAFDRLAQYIYDNSAFYSLNSYYEQDVNEYTRFAVKSYAALILTKQNKITPAIRNELKRLYQQVKSNENAVLLSPLPIMQLAIASKLAGYNRSFEDLLEIALATTRDKQYYWLGDYGSVIRDKAQMYNLLVEYQVAKDKQAGYLFALSDEIRNERYLSTQELNALFIASWQNQQLQDKEDVVVLLNHKESIQSKETIYRSMNYTDLAKGLTIQNSRQDSPLYIRFFLSGYEKKMPAPTPEGGVLSINRQYFTPKGELTSIERLKVGDLVIVMLDVSANRVITAR